MKKLPTASLDTPPAPSLDDRGKAPADPELKDNEKLVPPKMRKIHKHLTVADLLSPHKKALILGFLAVVGESAANLLGPWPIKIVLDDVASKKASHGAQIAYIQHWVGTDPMAIIKVACIAVFAIAALDAICSYFEKYFTTNVSQWITYDLRRILYAHIQRLSLAFHDQKRTGDLISRVTSDVDDIQSFINQGLLSSFINTLTLLGMVVVMFCIDWRFTLIAMSIVPPLFFIVFVYTRKIKKAARDARKREGQIFTVVQEVLSSIHVVKAFTREDYEQQRLEEASLESVETAIRSRSLKAKLNPIVDVVVAIGTSLVLWYGARLILSHKIEPGTLVLFVFYLKQMYKPMQELSKMTDTYSKAAVGFERIQEVLETDKEIKDIRGAKKAPKFKGKIEFDKVSFSYSPEQQILKDMSFVIEPGRVAALIGPTGVGKTTIVNMIARFYDPDSGVVKIDGTDIKKYKQQSLREQISFVLQDNVLFHGTIWQNIAYGRPEASKEEIIEAAKQANAAEFIDKMPQGYNTIVGERGITLSGGQRQRIAIARAIIRNANILILDEPTSGLDAASEKLVFEALDRLMEKKTAIVIAHRLSTIRRADVIFVVNNGAVVESGTHEQLMEKGGLYAELHELQFKQDEEKAG